jgi:hypothetical protein
MTSGQQLAQTLRKGFGINSRSRDRRDGGSIKRDMIEAIENAVALPGYCGPAKTAIYATASAVVRSHRKHVDGYRIDGQLRYHITSMTPWEFAGLLGEMVDAGITNVGEGEVFYAAMAKRVRS